MKPSEIARLSIGSTVILRPSFGEEKEITATITGMDEKRGRAVVDYVVEGLERWAYVDQITEIVEA